MTTNRPKCHYSVAAVETETGVQITIAITPYDGDKHKAIEMARIIMDVLEAAAIAATRLDLDEEWGDRPTE